MTNSMQIIRAAQFATVATSAAAMIEDQLSARAIELRHAIVSGQAKGLRTWSLTADGLVHIATPDYSTPIEVLDALKHGIIA